MTNIDPAIVEALTEWWASLCDDPDDAAFVRAAHETAEEAAAYAAALTPTLAAAVDTARAEGDKQGAARVRERVGGGAAEARRLGFVGRLPHPRRFDRGGTP